jgi:hypothetical protein
LEEEPIEGLDILKEQIYRAEDENLPYQIITSKKGYEIRNGVIKKSWTREGRANIRTDISSDKDDWDSWWE